MTFKKIMLVAHRWLGLISGVIVVVVSVTGCLFVFHQEISRWTRSDLMYVDTDRNPDQTLPLAELKKRAEEALGVDRLPYGLTTYNNPNRSWKALNYQSRKGSWTYFGSITEYETAYINPYNGQVLGVVDEEKNFFQIVKGLHWSLLLATPVGQPIVTWSTIVFIVLLITGIVLWWPRRWSRSAWSNGFTITMKSTWRRLNYDLHNVLGFYTLLLALVIAFTGLYWAFPTSRKTLYFAGTGQWRLPDDPAELKISSPQSPRKKATPIQIAYRKAWSEYPQAHNITLISPADSSSPLEAHIRPNRQTYYNENHMEFNPHTGKLLRHRTYEQKNAGEKLLAMNYDIHVGAIGGIFGKILAFIASLVCASLPVTGFIIWYSRKKRERRRKKRMERIIHKRRNTHANHYREDQARELEEYTAT